jgi:DUF4097 and DUF4098 domain-containing protein YvlB
VTSWEFATTGPISADITLPVGAIDVTAQQTDTVTVSLTAGNKAGQELLEKTEVSFDDGTLLVRTHKHLNIRGNASLDLSIGLPEGSSVTAETASGDLRLSGELGSLKIKTASGDVKAERISGDAEVNTASGDVRLDTVSGDVRVNTASGDASIGQVGGDIIAKTASGDVEISQAGQSATVKTASGDVEIASISTGLADVTTVSGDATIAVEPGVAVYLDLSALSGDLRSDLDSDGDAEGEASLTISCRTVSGDVRIRRAG